MTPVHIDAPVWRNYFDGRSPELGDRVDELIAQQLARVSAPVMQELLAQAATPAACAKLAEALLAVYAPADAALIALRAGEIACRLRAEGEVALPPLRLASAAAAIADRAQLLTTDSGLHAVARRFPLRVLCA